ncbi:MAG: DNA repair protein RecN [Candidatus Omnitrophica bacterium]|nr:DNA repair protein RecN [Candidatus Omnitrophota bacterium]
MLSQLNIRNFGLIEDVSLEFGPGLNILTGETGAGKTIIIEALRAVLGDRITLSEIRDTSLPCSIEAVFEIDPNLRKEDIFKDFISNNDPLIINRQYSSDGKNKIKINGLNVTLSQLKGLGNYLVDFHGPHDHQQLLSLDSHLLILDRMIDFKGKLPEYAKVFSEYKEIENKIKQLSELAQNRERELDLLKHQIKELAQVPLDEEKYAELLIRQEKFNNAEKLNAASQEAIDLLEGGENSLADNIRRAFSPMKTLNQLDKTTSSLAETLAQLQENSETLLRDLKDYALSLNFEPSESDEVNRLCDIYEGIKKKYGPSLIEANNFFVEAQKKYDLLSNIEENDLNLKKSLKSKEQELRKLADSITKLRQKQALGLKEVIEDELTQLGMPNVKFQAEIVNSGFGPLGQDKACFYLSPNKGEALKPLSDIVSSGEAARVMLGLKKALINVDPIPVLIFDEIDAQIGGRLGAVTGKKLREISRKRQVILITHLPQIASFADIHLKVLKKIKNGRTITTVEPLDKGAKVKELAQMMSGDKETEIAFKHAQDMLNKAEK